MTKLPLIQAWQVIQKIPLQGFVSVTLQLAPMDLNAQKEQFSNAFLQAVAATAGCNLAKPHVDDDSVDWIVSSKQLRRPSVDVQLKCTANEPQLFEDSFSFNLSIKNYEELRITNVQNPRILVVVFVPSEVSEWLKQDQQQLVLKKCSYWVSLRGMPETENLGSITVHLPSTQMFTPSALKGIMDRIATGGLP